MQNYGMETDNTSSKRITGSMSSGEYFPQMKMYTVVFHNLNLILVSQ